MESAFSGWRAPALLLVLVITLGTALRLVPCLRNPGFENAWEGQYHERLAREVVGSGRIAEVDSLSNAPMGRHTASHLPTGLYFAGAWMHLALRVLGSRNLIWNLALMQSLAGALIAIPVWLAAMAVFRDHRAAAIAATLAVFMPAHLGRSMGNDLRYDSLGTLLVATHVALSLAAWGESRPVRRWSFALGAALAFVAAMSVWRVSLLVLLPELAYAVLRFVVRGPEPAARASWLAMALVGTLGLLPVRYLAEHAFLLSPLWLSVVGFGVLLAIPGLGQGRWPLRILALAAIGVVALVWGRALSTGDYAGLASMLKTKLGWTHGHDPDAALMLSVVELQSTGLRKFLTSEYFFSILGTVFVLSPLLFWWLGGRPSLRRVLGMDAAPATLAFIAVTFAISTLLFQRSCVLLAPILAIVVGGLLARSWAALLTESAPAPRRGQRPRRASRPAETVLVALLALCALAAVASSVPMAWSRVMRLAPNERTAIEFLRTHARPGAVVMCDWDAGYEIQSRAKLATVTDGLLESAENRRRIIELYTAMMDPTSAPLEALCRRYHASWLLLPTSSAIYAMASVTGDPLADVLARHEGVPRGPLTDHLIVHLFEGDAVYPGLRRAVEAGGFTVFEIVEPPRSP